MSAGRLVAQGTLEELRQGGQARIRVVTPDAGAAAEVLSRLGLSAAISSGSAAPGGGEVLYAPLPEPAGNGAVAPEAVVAALVAAGVRVRGFAIEQVSLEDRFVALTGEGFDVVQ